MSKTHKKLTREEKLAKDRLRKREKYAQIKNNPELYSLQKEKERNRYLVRKEKNKICSIKDMTPRAQREQRRRWRKNSQNYLKKMEKAKTLERILVENSPPQSESNFCVNGEPQIPDPLTVAKPGPSTIKHSKSTQLSKFNNILRRIRYNHMKTVKILNGRIKKLEREKDVLRKRSNITQKVCDTIEKKVDEVLTEIRPDKKEAVKKQLLFSETISQNLQNTYKTMTKKDKRNFVDTVTKDDTKLRKYKLLHKLPFSRRKKKTATVENKQILLNKIHSFFEEDTNSRVAAGKKEFIKKKGVKKQKRYLNDNLKNLHEKFLKEQCSVSYSSFCKYRPYWVVFPKVDRDTCQCKLHSNVNLLIRALKNAQIIAESSGTHVINSLCCDVKQKCLERSCEFCANKVLNYHEFKNDKKIIFHQWVVEKKPYTGKDGKQKIKIVSIKQRFEDYPRNVIYKLESSLDTFLKHNLNITVQYQVIKQLKQNLKDHEILVHVDFSENYCLKYNEEIQSFHFGGSREQVSLHTGVLYYKDNDGGVFRTKSFCTISDCLKHDAKAIWAHLCPILKMAQTAVPYEIVHFLSDSPSSQYRNKTIFYMITKLQDINPNIRRVTWNYQESGHGKGAPDGIGAVVKRTADNFVKYGGDVGTYEDFWALVTKNIPNVYFDMITERDIEDKIIPPNIPGFKGTMKVHQIIWTADNKKTITLHSLSCFECQDCFIPCQHNKHLGYLNSDYYGETECGQSRSENEVTCIEDNQSICSIDTSTILNNLNLDESDVLKNLKPLEGPIDLQLSPILNISTSSTVTRSPKIKILSDVRISWENRKFYKMPKKKHAPKKLEEVFISKHQREFETFIQSNVPEEQEINSNNYEKSDDSDELNIF